MVRHQVAFSAVFDMVGAVAEAWIACPSFHGASWWAALTHQDSGAGRLRGTCWHEGCYGATQQFMMEELG